MGHSGTAVNAWMSLLVSEPSAGRARPSALPAGGSTRSAAWVVGHRKASGRLLRRDAGSGLPGHFCPLVDTTKAAPSLSQSVSELLGRCARGRCITPNRHSRTIRRKYHARRSYQRFRCAAHPTARKLTGRADQQLLAREMRRVLQTTAAIPAPAVMLSAAQLRPAFAP